MGAISWNREDARVLGAALLFWALYVATLTTESLANGRAWNEGVSPLRDITGLRVLVAGIGVGFCVLLHKAFITFVARKPGRALIAMVLAGVVTMLAIAIASFGVFRIYMIAVGDRSRISLLTYSLSYLWVVGAWCAGYFSYVQWRAAALEGERRLRAESEAQRAQLTALRYQMSPHFLFNALNAVAGLIAKGDTGAAERTVERLGDFLRRCLSSDTTHVVSLAEELRLQREYLEIERARFGARLRVEIVEPTEGADAPVPSLILQPLIENAVKHALAPSEAPVTIKVKVRQDAHEVFLRVEDDGPGVDPARAARGLGIGLSNTEARLRALYGERASLKVSSQWPRGFVAEICLPRVAA